MPGGSNVRRAFSSAYGTRRSDNKLLIVSNDNLQKLNREVR